MLENVMDGCGVDCGGFREGIFLDGWEDLKGVWMVLVFRICLEGLERILRFIIGFWMIVSGGGGL